MSVWVPLYVLRCAEIVRPLVLCVCVSAAGMHRHDLTLKNVLASSSAVLNCTHLCCEYCLARLKYSLAKLSEELLKTDPKVSIKQRFGYQPKLKNGSLSKLIKFPALDELQVHV